MLDSLFIFLAATYAIYRWAVMSTRYAWDIARSFRLSKYTVWFLIVAVISILPETFLSANAALKWIPEYGLATLFWSNIADLTLVLAIVVFVAGRKVKIASETLQWRWLYPFILFIPLILGINWHFSRIDGLSLIVTGGIFYYLTLRESHAENVKFRADSITRNKSILMLILSLGLLIIGSQFMIESSLTLAKQLWINSMILGMLIVWIGTTVPELFFAIQSVQKNDDDLAVGDILWTVLADATIVIGIIALIQPFNFPIKIIYFTGTIMLLASIVLFYFMKSGKSLTRNEAKFLIVFWILFAAVEIYLWK